MWKWLADLLLAVKLKTTDAGGIYFEDQGRFTQNLTQTTLGENFPENIIKKIFFTLFLWVSDPYYISHLKFWNACKILIVGKSI